MSMRVAWAWLPLLIACRPAHDPRRIQDALARTPIDVATLEEAFRLEPNALAIRADPLPAVTLEAPEPWALENVSSRPVWVRRSSLTVEATLSPFLAPSGMYGSRLGGRRLLTITRPSFDPAEWVLLYPGERTGLAFQTKGWAPGDMVLRAFVGDAGAGLVHAAREFNENRRLPFKGGAPAVALTGTTLILPPAGWPGAPWHETHPIEPVVIGRRVELTMPGPADEMGPVELEVFAAEGDRVTRGTMQAESFDATRGFAVYTLPGDVQGSRALFRAKDVAAYFIGNSNHRCDASDDAASRWISLTE